MADRTTLRLPESRKRKLDKAKRIIQEDEYDDPPMSDVIDAALTHLIESEDNIEDAREDPSISPQQIQKFNTSVLKLHYRTDVDSPWRR
ncbi:MAG: hypothetical protein ABEJ94_06770 [Halorientalis sp.]